MIDVLQTYWPHILAALSIVMGLTAAIHATMTKQEVRIAIGWVGVIILSPILGAVIYAIFGINRIKFKPPTQQQREAYKIEKKQLAAYDTHDHDFKKAFSHLAVSMKRLGDHVSRCSMTTGNTIALLDGGDEAYSAMMQAIDQATRSILIESYIFDRDRIGTKFATKLAQAVKRGVEVRILIDAVGARYSVPSIVYDLKKKYHVPVAVFNGDIIVGLRLPYANLRTHRKIMIVDGETAFTGGMNIRECFSHQLYGNQTAHDTHFKIQGPVVFDLFHIAAEDWNYAAQETLDQPCWQVSVPAATPNSQNVFMRVVPSGPDKTIETNQRMLIGAFSLAEHTIRIMTPYLLPDRELISALVTAARRGVDVDIVVPGNNNLKLVDRAMRAQFDQLLQYGCRVWRASGCFDHSKLISIDHHWSYIGSSNIDTRSLRLNFEVDIEIFDNQFSQFIAEKIEKKISKAVAVRLKDLQARNFLLRLLDKVIWLGSPYL